MERLDGARPAGLDWRRGGRLGLLDLGHTRRVWVLEAHAVAGLVPLLDPSWIERAGAARRAYMRRAALQLLEAKHGRGSGEAEA